MKSGVRRGGGSGVRTLPLVACMACMHASILHAAALIEDTFCEQEVGGRKGKEQQGREGIVGREGHESKGLERRHEGKDMQARA